MKEPPILDAERAGVDKNLFNDWVDIDLDVSAYHVMNDSTIVSHI